MDMKTLIFIFSFLSVFCVCRGVDAQVLETDGHGRTQQTAISDASRNASGKQASESDKKRIDAVTKKYVKAAQTNGLMREETDRKQIDSFILELNGPVRDCKVVSVSPLPQNGYSAKIKGDVTSRQKPKQAVVQTAGLSTDKRKRILVHVTVGRVPSFAGKSLSMRADAGNGPETADSNKSSAVRKDPIRKLYDILLVTKEENKEKTENSPQKESVDGETRKQVAKKGENKNSEEQSKEENTGKSGSTPRNGNSNISLFSREQVVVTKQVVTRKQNRNIRQRLTGRNRDKSGRISGDSTDVSSFSREQLIVTRQVVARQNRFIRPYQTERRTKKTGNTVQRANVGLRNRVVTKGQNKGSERQAKAENTGKTRNTAQKESVAGDSRNRIVTNEQNKDTERQAKAGNTEKTGNTQQKKDGDVAETRTQIQTSFATMLAARLSMDGNFIASIASAQDGSSSQSEYDYVLDCQVKEFTIQQKSLMLPGYETEFDKLTGVVSIDFSVRSFSDERQIKLADSLLLTPKELGICIIHSQPEIESIAVNRAADLIAGNVIRNIFPLCLVKVLPDGEMILNHGGRIMKNGDLYKVYRLGSEIVDPVTGKALGYEEMEIGLVSVTRVSDTHCYAKLVAGRSGDITPDIIFRKYTAPEKQDREETDELNFDLKSGNPRKPWLR